MSLEKTAFKINMSIKTLFEKCKYANTEQYPWPEI